MRMLYARRRAMLVNLIERRLGAEWLHRDSSDAGLHLVLNLPADMDDVRVVEAAHARGVLTRPLSRYYAAGTPSRPGPLLGYACVPESDTAPKFAAQPHQLAERARCEMRRVGKGVGQKG